MGYCTIENRSKFEAKLEKKRNKSLNNAYLNKADPFLSNLQL